MSRASTWGYDPEPMALRLRTLMAAQGMTPYAVAAAATQRGLPTYESTVEHIAACRTKNPGISSLIAIAVGLDIPLAVLLGLSPEAGLHPIAFRTAAFMHEELREAGVTSP